jgi:hypothetical protein
MAVIYKKPNAQRPSKEWPSERPSSVKSVLEVWCYTDRFSYRAKELVDVRVHTTAREYSLEVVRDGAYPEVVYCQDGIAGEAQETPIDSYRVGCNWPVSCSFEIPDTWRSGLYLLIVRAMNSRGETCEREHFFVLRADKAEAEGAIALILTTSTLTAYNDWGGANTYRGDEDNPTDSGSPIVSIKRPIARGFLRKPVGAPRHPNIVTPPLFWQPRYDELAWARLNGYTRHHSDAFWATFERPFVVWAERAGYNLHYLSQHDLHYDVNALDGYSCAAIVGHDEYWSWEMRDAVDAFVDRGGGLARFAGNFLCQIRLEQDGDIHVCYKLPANDPLAKVSPHLTTTVWESKAVGRPGATTMGLTGSGGAYTRIGTAAPRASGGFTVYRPDHWALEGSDLYYADVFGQAPISIAGYEVDGVEYTMRRGLPYPTHEDGAPDSLEIIALTPAVKGECDRWNGAVPLDTPQHEEWDVLIEALGDDAPGYLRERGPGAAMVASFTRGEGTVFSAGATEWVNGLAQGDPFTDRITRNVFERFGAQIHSPRSRA